MILRFLLLLLLTINVYAETTNPQDGVYQEKFNNGKLKYEISFLNGQKHGKEIFWYENGNKKMQSHFVQRRRGGIMESMV